MLRTDSMDTGNSAYIMCKTKYLSVIDHHVVSSQPSIFFFKLRMFSVVGEVFCLVIPGSCNLTHH